MLAHGAGYVMPWSGAATAYWPPGYPFFLAGLFKLFGQHVALAWGANIVLGSLTCVALYFIGRAHPRREGRYRCGPGAGGVPRARLLLVACPLRGHLHLSRRRRHSSRSRWLLAGAGSAAFWLLLLLGVVIGAAALVRGQGLFLIPLAAIFWWLRSGDWRRALRWTGLAALVALVVVTALDDSQLREHGQLRPHQHE